MIAWKKLTTKTKGLNASCGHSFNDYSESFEIVDLILSFNPSGGSVTTFNAFCKIPNGKASVGCVVSQSLKSLLGLERVYKNFYRWSLSQLANR
jgi:hypothetical protein